MTDITLLGHSAVQLRTAGMTLVIDPGAFSDLSGLAAATAVLITHGHADHAAPAALAQISAEVWAPADVIAQLEQAGFSPNRLHTATPGDTFTAAGFDVQVFGGEHAAIYPGLPAASNNAYLVSGTILHPGDSFTVVPDTAAVTHLLLPVAAPWLKLADAIDYARTYSNAVAIPVHDAILSEAGKQLTDAVATAILGGDTYLRVAPGSTLAA